MNILSWFRRPTGKQSGDQGYDPAGFNVDVNEETSMKVSAVWACVRLLSETVASLPIVVYEETDEGRKVAKNHPLYRLLSGKPNQYMTSVVFREAMMLNLCLNGNAYAEIQRNGRGDPIALNPLPTRQTTARLLRDGSLVYVYEQDGNYSFIASENMIHIKLFGNGIVGLSPISYASNAIGMSIGAEKYGADFYKKGGRVGGYLTFDKTLNDLQREQLRKTFNPEGVADNSAHRVQILEAGMKFEQAQISPNDMSMLDTRKFQVEDIARFFGVPGFLINDTSKNTTWGSGIEQMMIGFYKLNLKPYLTRWEQELKHSLLSISDQRKYTIEFNFEGLLRADSGGRAEFYSKTVGAPIMTVNEARKLENKPPVEGGDKLIAPLNMTELSKLGESNV